MEIRRIAAHGALADSRRKGFTLIELLVVLAVAVLLMSILLPALQRAREAAQRALCSSNCRQAGIAFHTYAESSDGRVIPMTNPSGRVMPFDAMEPWMSVLAYGPSAIIGDRYRPMHLAVLYETRQTRDPRVFYCPAQPRIAEYPFPFYYEFYTGHGSYPWGSQLATIPGVEAHTYVRTSYNYWTHGERRLDELPRRVMLVDNLQEWEIVPHRRGTSKPQGVSALFGDGHVRFCTGDDIFDEQLWPREPGWYNGPGDNRPVFDEILQRIEQNHQ